MGHELKSIAEGRAKDPGHEVVVLAGKPPIGRNQGVSCGKIGQVA